MKKKKIEITEDKNSSLDMTFMAEGITPVEPMIVERIEVTVSTGDKRGT